MINERAERLRNFCEAHINTPCVWGSHDCTQFAARWVRQETGRTLALEPYSSRAGAYRLIARAGDLAALWAGVMHREGFATTHDPKAGDVGIVETQDHGQIGVIWTRPGFAAWRTENGVKVWVPRPDKVIASWAVPA
jgi:hypothetical protein